MKTTSGTTTNKYKKIDGIPQSKIEQTGGKNLEVIIKLEILKKKL